MTTMTDVLTTVNDHDARRLLALAVQDVNDRERREQERANQQEAERQATYETIRAACTRQLPPVLRPYVRRLITDDLVLPLSARAVAVLELHFPDLELPLRARCGLANNGTRGPGAWYFQDYLLPGIYRVTGQTGARMAYSFEEQDAARCFDQQEALAYLVHLVADYRSLQAKVPAQQEFGA